MAARLDVVSGVHESLGSRASPSELASESVAVGLILWRLTLDVTGCGLYCDH